MKLAALAALVAASLVPASPAPAFAHHAWTEIESGREITLQGRVKTLKWENPHASLVLVTSDGGHPDEWIVQMSGLSRMESREMTPDVVAVGRQLTIVAVPFRNEKRVVRANAIRSGERDYVLY